MARKLGLLLSVMTFVMFFNYSYATQNDSEKKSKNYCMNDILNKVDKEIHGDKWQVMFEFGIYCIRNMYLRSTLVPTTGYREMQFNFRELMQSTNEGYTLAREIENPRTDDNINLKIKNVNVKKKKKTTQKNKTLEKKKSTLEDEVKKENKKNSRPYEMNNPTNEENTETEMNKPTNEENTETGEIEEFQSTETDNLMSEESTEIEPAYKYFLSYDRLLSPGSIKTPKVFCKGLFGILDVDCLMVLEILKFEDNELENIKRAFFILTVDDYFIGSSQDAYLIHICEKFDLSEKMHTPEQFCEAISNS